MEELFNIFDFKHEPCYFFVALQVKREYYKGCAHHLVGRGLFHHVGQLSAKTQETLCFLYGVEADAKKPAPASGSSSKHQLTTVIDIRVPKDESERQQLGNFCCHSKPTT